MDYLIGIKGSPFEERDFRIISAPTSTDAVAIFGHQWGIRNAEFLNHVYNQSTTFSFSELFWFQDDADVGEDDESNVSRDEFERRVRAFFPADTDYADQYIQYWYTYKNAPRAISDDPSPSIFPDAMLFYIWQNAEWQSTIAIPFDEIDLR